MNLEVLEKKLRQIIKQQLGTFWTQLLEKGSSRNKRVSKHIWSYKDKMDQRTSQHETGE